MAEPKSKTKDVWIVRINPETEIQRYNVGGKLYERNTVYDTDSARLAEKLRSERDGTDPRPVFLVQTQDEANAHDRAKLAQIRAPRGTVAEPVRVKDADEPEPAPSHNMTTADLAPAGRKKPKNR